MPTIPSNDFIGSQSQFLSLPKLVSCLFVFIFLIENYKKISERLFGGVVVRRCPILHQIIIQQKYNIIPKLLSSSILERLVMG
jgi:hypothetical protein